MSTVKTVKYQVGTDGTSTNNFTIYQPDPPDGTMRVGNGNADAPTDVMTVNSSGVSVTGNLSVTGNIPVNNTAPAFHATNNNTVQGIPNATFTKLILPEEIFDTNSNYDNATNYRFTPTVAGYYQFNSAVFFNNSATSGQVQIQVYKNGNSASFSGNAWNSFGHAWLSLSTLLYANGSTDYFELYVYQNGGSTQNTSNAATGVFFTGHLARAV